MVRIADLLKFTPSLKVDISNHKVSKAQNGFVSTVHLIRAVFQPTYENFSFQKAKQRLIINQVYSKPSTVLYL